MPHYEFQSVSRMKENFTYGLTGRNWKLIDDLCKKSLLRGESDDNTQSKIRRQFFTLLAVLLQILEQNIRHYLQLQQMIQQGRDADDYLHWINSGLDNSIGLLNSLPIKDESVLADLKEFKSALGKIKNIYGEIPQSPEDSLHTLHDETVAESLRMAHDFKEFSKIEEKNSEIIATEAREASPKGAARMQAETSAKILKSLSQLLRLNTQMLKLQSEQLAFQNKQSKDGVANYQKVSRDLGAGFTRFNPDMKLMRY